MNVLEGILAGITAIIGLVIFYAILKPFGTNNDGLGNTGIIGASSAYGLLIIIPKVIVAGVIIYILIRSFSGQ